MYELKDCPGARALVDYLKRQIQNCDALEYQNEGSCTGDEYYAKETAYRDVLNKIKIVR